MKNRNQSVDRMRGKIGSILFFAGFFLFIFTVFSLIDTAGNYDIPGLDLLTDKEDVTPFLVSGGVMLLGILLSSGKR